MCRGLSGNSAIRRMRPHSSGGRSGACSNKQAIATCESIRLISCTPKHQFLWWSIRRRGPVSRKRAGDLRVCRLAVYPCNQMRNATTVLESEQAKDRAATLRNCARLGANKNILFWYRELYRDQFKDFP